MDLPNCGNSCHAVLAEFGTELEEQRHVVQQRGLLLQHHKHDANEYF